jgi:hypothetical protein
MSPVTVTLRPPPGPPAAWWGPAFTLDAGGLVVLVTPADPPEGERYDPDAGLSLYTGPAATQAVLEALERDGEATAWCALLTPWPTEGGRLKRQPILRMGLPGGPLTPMVTLRADPRGVRLSFEVGGAPLLPPPARDRGGPIDQAFADASFAARAALAGWLHRLRERGFAVDVTGPGAEALQALLAAPGPERA